MDYQTTDVQSEKGSGIPELCEMERKSKECK